MFRRVPPPTSVSKTYSARAFWALPALACVLQTSAFPAFASETSGVMRPIVEASPQKTAQDSIMHFMAAIESDGSDGVFQRAFGSPKRTPSDTRLPDIAAEEKAAAVEQIIKMAAADPYFDRWQKDANERLKEEAGGKKVKLHPLQAATPDVSVIVCEAGCKTLKDEVVYTAAYVPAQVPTRSFEPASSGNQSTGQQGGSISEPGVDEGSLPCIAGCYERPERRKYSGRASPSRTQRAEVTLPAAMLQAASYPAASLAAHPAQVITGAIERAAYKPAISRPRIRTAFKRIQLGHNGAIVEGRRPKRTADSKGKAAHRLLKAIKVTHTGSAQRVLLQGWRTKVIVAPTQALHETRTPALRALKSARHAVRTIRTARISAR